MSDKAEQDARDIVIPWENFNINAWEGDMGSLARSHLIGLVAAALRQRDAELERLLNGELELREHVEAERDAAVEALEWIKSEGMDDGDIHGCDQFTLAEAAIMLLNRAREALARLPQAAERAQAARDVIAAARDVDSDIHPKDYSEILGRLSDALARLDALDEGGGSDG